MTTHADRTKEKKSQSGANRISQKQNTNKASFQFADNRPEAAAQRELQAVADNSPRAMQTAQFAAMADIDAGETVQKRDSLEEEPLQGKFETIQKQSPEEEELMQGKFETAQKASMDDEELMQGEFDPIQKKKRITPACPTV